MATRCKFVCTSKREYKHYNSSLPNLFEYEFSVVTGGSPENDNFFASTPSGSFKVGVVRDGTFEVGAVYYFDISKA